MSTETEIDGAVVPSAVIAPVEGGLSAFARAAVEAGRALRPETLRAYKRDMKDFSDWCRREGREPLPASANTLTEYATWLCYQRPVLDRGGIPVPGAPPGLSPKSAQRMLSSVAATHKYAGLPAPSADDANSVVKGYQEKLAEGGDARARPAKAVPLTPAAIGEMTGRGLSGAQELIRLRDTAMLYLAYNTASRVSELVRADIEGVTEHDWGLSVLLRRSKHGPFEDVLIPAEHAPAGVAAIRRWVSALKEHGITSGPLFPRIDRAGRINPARKPNEKAGSPDGRITERWAERIVAAMAAEAGLEGRYTVHSGRRGMATQARMAGHDKLTIARHGGWTDRSAALDGYIDDADRLRLNPLRGAGA